MNFGPSELLIVLIVLLVIFGGSKIPKLARNLGQAQSEFKKGLSQVDESPAAPPTPASPAGDAPTAAAPTADAPTFAAPPAADVPTSFAPPPPPPPAAGPGPAPV
jgi:sec-independent protein translocase protein TatA